MPKESKEDIVKATLECLRRVFPHVREEIRKTPLIFKAAETDHAWVEKIVNAFNTHDHSKPFFTPPS